MILYHRRKNQLIWFNQSKDIEFLLLWATGGLLRLEHVQVLVTPYSAVYNSMVFDLI